MWSGTIAQKLRIIEFDRDNTSCPEQGVIAKNCMHRAHWTENVAAFYLNDRLDFTLGKVTWPKKIGLIRTTHCCEPRFARYFIRMRVWRQTHAMGLGAEHR